MHLHMTKKKEQQHKYEQKIAMIVFHTESYT